MEEGSMEKIIKRIQRIFNQNTREKIYKVLLITAFSFLVVLLLDSSSRNFKFIHTLNFISNHKKNLFLSTLVIGLIVSILLVLFNNLVVVLGGLTYFFILFALSNFVKIQLRAEPILPSDIGSLRAFTDLMQMVEFKFIILFILFTLVSMYAIYRLNKKIASTFFSKNKFGYSLRLTLTIIALFSSFTISNVHAQNNSFRKGINRVGFHYYRGSTLLSYQRNSFVLSFIDNLPGPAMDKPDQYSKQEIYSILEKYQMNTDLRNKNKSKESFDDISVIYILSESLSDPRVIPGTNLEESPIPYIQDISDKNMVGKAIVPVYGGGTPNSEFELLTGLAIQNLRKNMSIPYQKVLPYKESFPNFVKDYKKDHIGSVAKAIHSYNSRLFKRRDVFPILGFDELYFDRDMNHQYSVDNDSRISDAALYEETLDHLKNDSRDQFLHLLSMQNHSAYEDVYKDYTFHPKTDGSEKLDELLKYYLQGIHITDKETEKFIEQLDQLDRKVAVVFYGDHHPGIYSDLIHDTETFDRYTTDYFIYTNFNDTKIESDEPLSLTNFNNYLYDLAEVKTNAIHQLIWELRKEVLAGIDDDFLLKDNQVAKYEELSINQQELIEDYYSVQYDIVEGKSYSQDYIQENGW